MSLYTDVPAYAWMRDTRGGEGDLSDHAISCFVFFCLCELKASNYTERFAPIPIYSSVKSHKIL